MINLRSFDEILNKRSEFDVLLINPPVTKKIFFNELADIEKQYWEVMNKLGTLWGDHKLEPNLGLLSIASVLRNKRYKVDLIDFNIYDHYCRDNYNLFLDINNIKEILKRKRAKIFAISSMTVNFKCAEQIIKIIKEIHPDSLIVLGGIHATFNAKDILINNKNIDFVIIGEGEETFPELLDCISKDKKLDDIKGIAGRYKNKLFYNPHRDLIKDLDELPLPSFELLPKELTPFLPRVYTSRGCSHSCKFCEVNCFFKNKIRFRGPKKVFEEIKQIKDKFDPSILLVGDLTFFDNKKLSKQLCEILAKEKLDLNWWCQSRVDRIDKNSVELMKKAGCYQIALGMESSSEIFIKNMTLQKSIDACKTLKRNNLIVQTYWMFGLPEDNFKTSNMTIGLIKMFIRENLTDLTHIGINVPYPGTEFFKNQDKYGVKIINKNFEDYWMNCDDVSSGLPVYKTKYLSETDIYQLWLSALKESTKEYLKILNKRQ